MLFYVFFFTQRNYKCGQTKRRDDVTTRGIVYILFLSIIGTSENI